MGCIFTCGSYLTAGTASPRRRSGSWSSRRRPPAGRLHQPSGRVFHRRFRSDRQRRSLPPSPCWRSLRCSATASPPCSPSVKHGVDLETGAILTATAQDASIAFRKRAAGDSRNTRRCASSGAGARRISRRCSCTCSVGARVGLGATREAVGRRPRNRAWKARPSLDEVAETVVEQPETVLADAEYSNERDSAGLTTRGIDGYVSSGREARAGAVPRPGECPTTNRMGETLSTPVGRDSVRRAQVVVGGSPRPGIKHVPEIAVPQLAEVGERCGPPARYRPRTYVVDHPLRFPATVRRLVDRRRPQRSSPSCLTRAVQRTDFFHGRIARTTHFDRERVE